MTRRWALALGAWLLAAALLAPVGRAHGADTIDLPDQLATLALSGTRSQVLTPSFLASAAADGLAQANARATALAADPGRHPDPNFCSLPLCVGDPRLDDWAAHGGIVRPVLFTARDGATLSGHVWATRRGPRHRPGVEIINGSIIGFESAYWWAAQALAKAGYVVLTFDAQGEGDSDQAGEAPDAGEDLVAGSPPIGDGGGFYDGGEDALDFFLSTPRHPYTPVPSRTSGTSHAAKQRARVAAGFDVPYDPLWRLLDRRRIGLAGHSYGAEAASYLAQYDHRVSAVVAWDALCVPQDSHDPELDGLLLLHPESPGALVGFPLPAALVALPKTCFGAPSGYPATVPLRTPGLGITGDYVVPSLFTQAPERGARSAACATYNAAGVDAACLTVRGASHVDWTFVSAVPVATLRGIDLATWYTVAWFDKYLRRDPTADARLLTQRWRNDAINASVDLQHDPNMLSRWYSSTLRIHTASGIVGCNDLRAGCSSLVPAARDCGPGTFSYVAVDTAPDASRGLVRRRC